MALEAKWHTYALLVAMVEGLIEVVTDKDNDTIKLVVANQTLYMPDPELAWDVVSELATTDNAKTIGCLSYHSSPLSGPTLLGHTVLIVASLLLLLPSQELRTLSLTMSHLTTLETSIRHSGQCTLYGSPLASLRFLALTSIISRS